MSDSTLFALIFSGVWGIIGIVFLGVGIVLRTRATQDQERLRARAEATVVSFVDHFGTYRGSTTHSRNPVVEFNYEGRTISVECMDGLGPRSFYEGQKVEILHDPNDPSFIRMAGFQPEGKLGVVFIVIGIGCIALGIGGAMLVKVMASPE